MRIATFLLPLTAALALAACARQQQTYYVVDPQTGQQVPVVQQYSGPEQYVQAQYAQQQQQYPQQQAQYAQSGNRGLFGSSQQLTYAQPQYPPQATPAPSPANDSNRGLFNHRDTQPQYSQPYPQQSYTLQYQPPQPYASARPYAPPSHAYDYAAPGYQTAYTLDAGDRLRVSVFGQEGISGSYLVDAGGNLNLPLIGTVPARGFTTEQLSRMIGERLKQGYVREPHVTVSIETYRPFFIMGEVTTPGQYVYVPNMTAENAVAIAGGFAPRAKRDTIELTRNAGGQRFTSQVPLNYPMQPGDTVVVKERWF
ncbi:MAG TPA: polysaccharide biosynthesis/export family protein [Pseudolabrys sp.]|nr:polysaccharide biosynthesis/export family protein [Pseudolabrys sp.]